MNVGYWRVTRIVCQVHRLPHPVTDLLHLHRGLGQEIIVRKAGQVGVGIRSVVMGSVLKNGHRTENRDKSLEAYHAETTDQVTCLVSGDLLEKAIGRTASATENELVTGIVTGSVTKSATGSGRKKRIVVSAIVTETETGIVIVGMIRIVIIRERTVKDQAGRQVYPLVPPLVRKVEDCRHGPTQVDIAVVHSQVTMLSAKGDVPMKMRSVTLIVFFVITDRRGSLIGLPNGARARRVTGRIAVDAPTRKVTIEVENPIGADQNGIHLIATHAYRQQTR